MNRKAQERLEKLRAEKIARRGLRTSPQGAPMTHPTSTPVHHLLEALGWSSSLARALGEYVSDGPLTTSGPHGDDIHPVHAEWERECERRAKLAKTCPDAGVEERMGRVAEQEWSSPPCSLPRGPPNTRSYA